jgi:hypothetical protein
MARRRHKHRPVTETEPPLSEQTAIAFAKIFLRLWRDGADYDDSAPIVEVEVQAIELATLGQVIRQAFEYMKKGQFDSDEFEQAIAVPEGVFRTNEAQSRLKFFRDVFYELASGVAGSGHFADNVALLFSKARARTRTVDEDYSVRYDDVMKEPVAIDFSAAAEHEVAPRNVSGWPTEKYNDSDERKFNKRFAIVRFLVRVWKPVLEESGRLITISALKKIDEPAARSLYAYVKRAGMPDALKGLILTDGELKQQILEQPGAPSAVQRVIRMSALG